MEMMILHGQAVRRGLSRALMVVDMPFGAYEEGPTASAWCCTACPRRCRSRWR
ncbi:hypothetical protein CNY89_28925, partial [Amaricoccus sp. HAR-UPW-R2A-40]